MGGGFPKMTANPTNLQKKMTFSLVCAQLTNGFPVITVWLKVETWCGEIFLLLIRYFFCFLKL